MEHPSQRPLQSAPMTSIQPGGGLGPWLLRLVGGPSIAWFRNVCSAEYVPATHYLFTPHPLRFARAGLAELLFFSFLFGGLCAVSVWLALAWHAVLWVPAV